jgi:copper chaperone CopZ
MNSITKGLMAITLLLSAVVSTAQIKNSKTETVKIFGNCGMCESKIEKAGNQKDIASVDWNKDSKMATLIYDSKITNKDEILKRIALVGYDSEQFHAEEAAFNKLPGCCQYDRAADVKEEKENTVHRSQAVEVQRKKK